ncbi:hypothetical protein AMTRI_Chr07g76550 [Amborella trichopoda]
MKCNSFHASHSFLLSSCSLLTLQCPLERFDVACTHSLGCYEQVDSISKLSLLLIARVLSRVP